MMYKDDLLEQLRRLDEDADLIYDDDRRFQMIIVGGSALVLLDVISRSTQYNYGEYVRRFRSCAN